MACEDKGRHVHVFTHHHKIVMTAWKETPFDPVTHEFTFDQLYSLIRKLAPGIEKHV